MSTIIQKLNRFITNPKIRFSYLNALGFYKHTPDDVFLKKAYKVNMGQELNLENPQTFNEKLQWLKLYNRKPEYTVMVDKYKVREYIAKELGEGYLIPLLGVWDDPDEIDFDALPDQFVLKCNHNSGLGMCICKDKSKLDIEKVKRELRKGLAQDYYLTGREWPYKNVPRKIICEKYMTDETGTDLKEEDRELVDYKFFCFNGVPKFMYISHDHASNATTDFFDMDFHRLDMRMKDPNSDIIPSRPVLFDNLKVIAEKLSAGIPFVRVDMYVINGQIYFGELTFFHNAGFTKVHPEQWEKTLGDWIDISQV